MSREEHLIDICKNISLSAVCKRQTEEPFVSEHELTKMAEHYAKKANISFAKLYEQDLELRKAFQATKHAAWAKAGRQQLMPTEPTFHDATAQDVNDDSGGAYEQLMEMAQRMHAASPERSVAQHFSAIYTDPKFRDKAARERAQARSRLPITGGKVGVF
jgi:hypothetical protein